MRHDPLVCIEDAIKACELISQFIQDMTKEDFYADAKTKAVNLASLSDTEPVNYSTIARDCGVSSQTVKEYFQISPRNIYLAPKTWPRVLNLSPFCCCP